MNSIRSGERTLRLWRASWPVLATLATLVQLSPAACSDTSGQPRTNGGGSGAGGTSAAGGADGPGGDAGYSDRGGAGANGTGGRETGGTSGVTGETGGTDAGGTGGEGNEAGEAGAGGGGPMTHCGDGSVEVGEACDDANANAGDGCSECAITPGWACGAMSPSRCRPRVVSIATAESHTCVALSTGAVACWGQSMNGETGYPGWRNIGDDEVPAVAGLVDVGAPVRQVSAGEYATCALLHSGSVRCWGYGGYGQLGYGNGESIGDGEAPRTAGDVDVGGPVRQIVTGHSHSCALLENGAVRCWGYGGLLGYEHGSHVGDDETPAQAGDVNVGGPVRSLAAGRFHTCALLESGAVRCWGLNSHGALGYGNELSVRVPADAGDVNVGDAIVVELVAGSDHTCARLTGGRVRCWGFAQAGILGYGNTEHVGDDETPASVGDVPVGAPALRVTAGDVHTCVLTTEGAVRCWGQAWGGQTGHGNTTNIGDDELPSSVRNVELGGTVEMLSSGGNHNCAVLSESGSLRCWGSAEFGQLGYGNRNPVGDDESPASAGDVDYY
ncbi:MAG TPA: hypothetical protein VFZ53_19215 [Polyangiaceae bacterium]